MFCRNCGKELNPQMEFCTGCGCKKGDGNSYCPKCGKEMDPKASACVSCGYILPQQGRPAGTDPTERKSVFHAGLLGLLFGTYGVHNFYLGNKKKALIQLLLTLLGCGVGAVVSYVWSFVESIQILTGKINTDANGVRLKY